jgi:enoyl-CoA hydratase
MQASVTSIADLAVPVIAAIHGYCIGGGVDLVSACDVRLCANDATFSVRETKVAIVADLGSLQRLPKIISAGHLAELAYTGKDIDAQRALAIGLVNAVYGSSDEVLAGARALALEIARTLRSPCRARRPCLRPMTDGVSTRVSNSSRAGTRCIYRAMICARR